jgi:hypothetical protein
METILSVRNLNVVLGDRIVIRGLTFDGRPPGWLVVGTVGIGCVLNTYALYGFSAGPTIVMTSAGMFWLELIEVDAVRQCGINLKNS